jgi:hypothetical protein
MTWPFEKPAIEENNPEPAKQGEKSPAELIAESLSAALKPVLERFDAQDKRFETLEAQTKPREPKPATNLEEPVSVLDDEGLAFAQRLTPLMARQFELESSVVRDRIFREYRDSGYGDLLSQFEGEITQLLDSAPLVTSDGKPLRGDPQYIRNVIDMLFGRKARAGGMRFDGKSKGFFLEPAGGSSNPGAQHDEMGGLTEGQRKVMDRMGIPLEDAKKVIKKLHFV